MEEVISKHKREGSDTRMRVHDTAWTVKQRERW